MLDIFPVLFLLLLLFYPAGAEIVTGLHSSLVCYSGDWILAAIDSTVLSRTTTQTCYFSWEQGRARDRERDTDTERKRESGRNKKREVETEKEGGMEGEGESTKGREMTSQWLKSGFLSYSHSLILPMTKMLTAFGCKTSSVLTWKWRRVWRCEPVLLWLWLLPWVNRSFFYFLLVLSQGASECLRALLLCSEGSSASHCSSLLFQWKRGEPFSDVYRYSEDCTQPILGALLCVVLYVVLDFISVVAQASLCHCIGKSLQGELQG